MLEKKQNFWCSHSVKVNYAVLKKPILLKIDMIFQKILMQYDTISREWKKFPAKF